MLKEIILLEHFHTSVIKNDTILKGEKLNTCTQEYFFFFSVWLQTDGKKKTEIKWGNIFHNI